MPRCAISQGRTVSRIARLIGYDGRMGVKPSDKPKEFIEAWIGYVYKNSVYWNMTAGELHFALYHLHHLWAGITGRFGELTRISSNVYVRRIGKRVNRVRDQQVSDPEVHKIAVKMWQKIDRKMGLEPQADQYDQFIQP